MIRWKIPYTGGTISTLGHGSSIFLAGGAKKIFFRERLIQIGIKILDPWVFRFCSKIFLSKMTHTLDFR